jgi:drug/metabolite transporter (DMT)-like permease
VIPLLVFQQLIASSTHLVAKSATLVAHPALVVLIRGCFSALFFSGWLLLRRSSLTAIDREDWPRIILLGLLNIPINQLLFIWGVQYGSAPNAALAYALSPTFVVILMALSMRAVPSRMRMFGIATALLGTTVVLIDKGADVSSKFMLGNIMVLCASMAWATYTVLGRRLAIKYGGFHLTALTMLVGLAMYIPVYLLMPITIPTTPLYTVVAGIAPAVTWFQLAYLGIITSGIGFGLWYVALARLDAARLSVFNNLQPILTTLLAWAILGQQPTVLFAAGGIIALAGVWLTQRSDG